MTIRQTRGTSCLSPRGVGCDDEHARGSSHKDVLAGAGKRLNLGGQQIRFVIVAHSGANGEEAGGRYVLTRETESGTVCIEARFTA